MLKKIIRYSIFAAVFSITPTLGQDVLRDEQPLVIPQQSIEQKEHLVQELNKKLSAFGIKKVYPKPVIEEGKLNLEDKLNRLSIQQINQIFTLICQMDWLISLNLACNQLASIPDSLGNLPNLKELFLFKNNLEDIPSSLGNLSQLTKLHLFYNKLQHLPDSLGRLVNLEYLYLSNNLLQSIPETLGNLVKLLDLRLNYNKLQTVPAILGGIQTLRIINLQGNSNLRSRGETIRAWGQFELCAHFGDRLILGSQWSTQSMKSTTTARQVYDELEQQSLRINREIFAANKLPDIQVASIFDGEEMLVTLIQILTILNFQDDQSPGYLSYEVLANDYASEGQSSPVSNFEKIWHYLLPRLTGYIKALYNIPLGENEVQSWNMYEAQIPETQKVLTFILERILNQSDIDTRALWFLQLVNGLLHCPTGQAEAVNAVAYAMMDGSYKCKDFKTIIDHILAVKKNMAFTQAILAKGANNTQNVHLPSYYRDLLKNELGLTSAIVSYRERMGVFSVDPFSKNKWNVVREFYKFVTPQRLIDWICEAAENHNDRVDLMMLRSIENMIITRSTTIIHLDQRINKIKRFLDNYHLDFDDEDLVNQSSESLEMLLTERRKQLTQELETAQAVLLKEPKGSGSDVNKKGLSTKDVIQYLVTHGLMKSDQMEEWFERESFQEEKASMTKSGQMKLLSYLKNQIKKNKQLRPLTVGDAVRYLVDEKCVNPEQMNWWQKYFSTDPVESLEATLTQEGIKGFLLQRGYLIETVES